MIKSKDLNAVFFDFDGTLVDSIQLLYKVYIDFLSSYGIIGTREEFNKLNGPSIKEVAIYLNENYGLEESNENVYFKYEKLLIGYYSTHLSLKKNASIILKELLSNNISTYLVTSAEKELINPFIQSNKLEFRGITFGNEILKSKPDPEIYLYSLKKFNCQSKNVVVVEDSKNGILSALKANLIVCALIGTHTREELEILKPHHIIDDLLEITKIIMND